VLSIGAGWLALTLMRLATNFASGLLTLNPAVAHRRGSTRLAVRIPTAALILWIDRSRLASHGWRSSARTSCSPGGGVYRAGLARVRVGDGRHALQVSPRSLSHALDINYLVYAVIVVADIAWIRLQALKARELAAAVLAKR